jgi:hypothetical protein
MIYVLEDSGEKFTVKAPDQLNHDMATKVILANQETWELKEVSVDDNYISDTEHHDMMELVPPSLFIDRNEDTGRLVPDMDYMNIVDKKFMDDMLYYWSKTGRTDYMRLLDEIEDNIDELIDSCFVIDILT